MSTLHDFCAILVGRRAGSPADERLERAVHSGYKVEHFRVRSRASRCFGLDSLFILAVSSARELDSHFVTHLFARFCNQWTLRFRASEAFRISAPCERMRTGLSKFSRQASPRCSLYLGLVVCELYVLVLATWLPFPGLVAASATRDGWEEVCREQFYIIPGTATAASQVGG
jgi:hypothetical protein